MPDKIDFVCLRPQTTLYQCNPTVYANNVIHDAFLVLLWRKEPEVWVAEVIQVLLVYMTDLKWKPWTPKAQVSFPIWQHFACVTYYCWEDYMHSFFKFFKCLFIFDRERQHREGQREGARGSEAGSSLTAESQIRGLNPWTTRPCPELKSAAQPTEPPRYPGLSAFLYDSTERGNLEGCAWLFLDFTPYTFSFYWF